MPILERICFGCGTFIDDLYYLMIVNRSWHLSCLKCFDCGILLEQEKTCFTKNGQIFCKDDYRRRSCVCTRCKTIIKQNEIIHRVEDLIFHLKCLKCVNCNILLHPGDEFGLKDNHIYCRDHFLEQQSLNSHLILDDSGYHTSPNETRQSKIDDEHFLTLSPTLFSPSYYIEHENNQLDCSHHSKQKRLRTSFKHQQLRYMRSYFNLNHNPDAKDLKNLSEKTNLSKRVLQVWFQNARAKYRRSNTLFKDDRTNTSTQLETCISPS